MTDHADAFVAALDVRISDILDRCTRCGKCVEVCPTAGPAGIDTREPTAIVTEVLEILRGGGDASSRGARWAATCPGSGVRADAYPLAPTEQTRASGGRRPACD